MERYVGAWFDEALVGYGTPVEVLTSAHRALMLPRLQTL